MNAEEVKAISELLEGEYPTAKAMAAAIYKGTEQLIMKRDSYGIGIPGVAYGPFYDLRSAKKIAGIVDGKLARLYSPARLAERALTPLLDSRYCEDCNHPWFAHSSSSFRVYGEAESKPQGCCVKACDCVNFLSTRGKAA